MNQYRILIVDESSQESPGILKHLAARGYEVDICTSAPAAAERMDRWRPLIVICNLNWPSMDALNLLSRSRSDPSSPAFVIVTDHKSIKAAVHAMKSGAEDFLVTPLDLDELERVIRRIMKRHELRSDTLRLTAHIQEEEHFDVILGRSEPMQRARQLIERTAASDAPILLMGERGTGKQIVATAIHKMSGRASEPFIKIDCSAAALAPLEREMFGHEQDTGNGQRMAFAGKFELAHRGTVFLNGISRIPLFCQIRLLRLIEDHQLERVGGTQPVPADTRIIAATSSNLKAAVHAGTFRLDLLYRLAVIPLEILPLRDRRSELPGLVKKLAHTITAASDSPILDIEPEALDLIMTHSWPGNLGELLHVLERAVSLPHGHMLGLEQIRPFMPVVTPQAGRPHKKSTQRRAAAEVASTR